MSWQVVADVDFSAAYGSRVLTFTEGEVIEGEVARYLAAAGAPVTPAPELDVGLEAPARLSAPTAKSTPRRGSRGGARHRG